MNLFVVIGAIIGFAFGRWSGLLLGALIGYWGSRALRRAMVRTVQTRFVDATFAVMGAVCKVDGRVSSEEIRAVERLFDQLRLSGDARESAKAAFNRGKLPGFDLDSEVQAFRQSCRGQRAVIMMFLHVQLAAVAADGAVNEAEHRIMLRIARGLGLSEAEVLQLEAMMRGRPGASGGGPSARSRLDDAYAVLGVSADVSDADLKRQYRKLMSENHPDKLAARGLPESMRQMAEEKTRAITGAYDVIKEARGLA